MTREEAIEVYNGLLNQKIKEAFEFFAPELAESEDERIRKEMIETIRCISSDCQFAIFLSEQQKQRYLAYLEKQKERKPWKVGENAYFDPNTEMWFIKKKQKPNFSEKDSTDFEIEVHEIIAQARNDSRLDDADVLKQFEEEAAFALMLKANKLIEQKPVDLQVKGDGVYKICPRCKERMVRDDSMVYTSMPPQYRYECPKCGESECDTVMYDNPEMDEQKPDNNISITPERLKELRDKSFEDGRKAGIAEMAKSMPLPEDTVLFNKGVKEGRRLEREEMWKPSEEQMTNLLRAEGRLRIKGESVLASKLAELYEQLKKL